MRMQIQRHWKFKSNTLSPGKTGRVTDKEAKHRTVKEGNLDDIGLCKILEKCLIREGV